uniref:Uncharacterized protein n=1 Tax=mine drainage metagenome TaxID=410659 RepID=E6QAK2_9ZZZZ
MAEEGVGAEDRSWHAAMKSIVRRAHFKATSAKNVPAHAREILPYGLAIPY